MFIRHVSKVFLFTDFADDGWHDLDTLLFKLLTPKFCLGMEALNFDRVQFLLKAKALKHFFGVEIAFGVEFSRAILVYNSFNLGILRRAFTVPVHSVLSLKSVKHVKNPPESNQNKADLCKEQVYFLKQLVRKTLLPYIKLGLRVAL